MFIFLLMRCQSGGLIRKKTMYAKCVYDAWMSSFCNFLTTCDTICHLLVATTRHPRQILLIQILIWDQCACQQSCPYMLNICAGRNFVQYWVRFSNLASRKNLFFAPPCLQDVISLFTLLNSSFPAEWNPRVMFSLSHSTEITMKSCSGPLSK